MQETWNNILKKLVDWAGGFAGNLLLAALILLGGWWLAKLAAKLTKRTASRGKADALVVSFIGSLVKTLVLVVACISAVAQLGINITSLIAALGAAGLTASFALQGSLSNLVSGMQIIFTKPFKMGDYLAFGTYEGTVKRIEILSTTLATFDNKEVIIPNSKITGDVVVNFLSYGISYGADLKRAKALLARIAEEEERVLKNPAPVIAVGELKESSVTLVAKLWCSSGDYWNLYYSMQERVKLAFDKEKIAIPFPQLDVHLDQMERDRPG